MIRKQVITMLFCLLGSACSSQPQYWAEGAYDLENVAFGTDVNVFYSKAADMAEWDFSEPYNPSTRYFVRDTVECGTEDGRTMTILDFGSPETDYSEVLARFGRFEFPYTGMLADTEGRMIGILASNNFDELEEVNALLAALGEKYGTYQTLDGFSSGENYGWRTGDSTIQLYIKAPDPGHMNAVFYQEVDENGNRRTVGGGSQPHVWYECVLMVTQTAYDPFIDKLYSGEWCTFRRFANLVPAGE